MRFAHAAAAVAFAVLLTQAQAQDLDIPENGYIVSDDLARLPEPVAEKRAALIAAAENGDIAALRSIFEGEPAPVTVSFGDPEDPIDHLRRESSDGEGLEILAILADVLEAPYAVQDGGDGEPVYVWPYLAAFESLADSSPADRVEGIRIAGFDNFQLMQEFGVWIYWRAFITPEGHLQAFVAGD